MKPTLVEPSQEPLLKPDQAAEMLGVEETYLARLRREGGGPEYVRIGFKTVRYPPAALRQYIADQTFASTSAESVRRMANAIGG